MHDVTPDFETAWAEIQERLNPGTVIPNWTRDRGYLGGDYEVVAVKQDEIAVVVPSTGSLLPVQRYEFERLFSMWEGYVQHEVPRHQLRDASRFQVCDQHPPLA